MERPIRFCVHSMLLKVDSRCLNTVLREIKPPIFCSRTCRMDTVLGTPKKEGKGLEFAKDLGRQNAVDLASISLIINVDCRNIGME